MLTYLDNIWMLTYLEEINKKIRFNTIDNEIRVISHKYI